MTGVAPWLTATVCFVDLDQLPRDLRLEVRTAGRLVAPNCYDVVASYALSYSQAARGTVPVLEQLFANHQNLDGPWNRRPRKRWHTRTMSVGDLVALTLSDYPPKWWACEAMGFRLLREDERSPFTARFFGKQAGQGIALPGLGEAARLVRLSRAGFRVVEAMVAVVILSAGFAALVGTAAPDHWRSDLCETELSCLL